MAYLFLGCSSYPPLPTVEKVDLKRYLGQWYEIARYEHFFEKGCSDVTATYSLKTNGDIKVINRCKKAGEFSKAVGQAYAVDDTHAKLKVSFFWPFYGNYWILDLDKSYSYAVIGEPSREYFWILSRTKNLNREVLDSIFKQMPQWGYETENLIWTQHIK
jgi:apolipoprotein D and lipocalin family protein